jgi:hypothetical protein
LSQGLDALRPSRARHDPGRVLVHLAVAVADGATTISEIAVLGEQCDLFGQVASDSTCWRLLDLCRAKTLRTARELGHWGWFRRLVGIR